jgi:1-acyl-sn-glycerol-3-phosphate acyltransferase
MTVKYFMRRRLIQFGGRLLQPILSRTTIIGRENIPQSGPLIVVGNHAAYVEPILMVLAMPWPIELLAADDVPIREKFGWLRDLWGFVPIHRGEVDRAGLKGAASVLAAGDSIGIFPEGGVWDRRIGDARLGVAYLSQQTGAPILPIGFGGLIGATAKILRWQRPRLTVNIGPVIPAVASPASYRERKVIAQSASNGIMDAIYRLVPPDDEISKVGGRTEQYAVTVTLTDATDQGISPPPELAIASTAESDNLGAFFYRPVLISVVIDNLERPAEPLRHLDTERDPAAFSAALREALQVFTQEKPAFLGYRLGYKRAGQIVATLEKLRQLADWAAARDLRMHVSAKATFTYSDGRVEHFDTPPDQHER